MNIILISNKMAKAKSLSALQVLFWLAALMLIPILLTLLFITPQSNIKTQGVKALLPPQIRNSIISSQVHLDAYAKELGELQARIMRLDAQNERLAALAGEKDIKITNQPNAQFLKKSELNTKQGNMGGPFISSKPMSEPDLQAAILALTEAVDIRDDYLSSLEAKILQKSVLKDMLPNSSPVDAAFNSSSYGWRTDPFNGDKAFHEGLDFTANMGTAIKAAADGIVTTAEQTPDYGKIVKINHRNTLCACIQIVSKAR